MNWWHFIIVFGIIILLRFVLNLVKLRRTMTLQNKYNEYLRGDAMDLTFYQYKSEIISLFKEAGLKDSTFQHQELLGYGRIATARPSVFENLGMPREDIVINIIRYFNQAIGIYRKRMIESFNPIFWIEMIIKLPQYILEFFGVLPEKIIVKVLVVLYWILAIIFGLERFNIIEFLTK